MGTNGGWPQRPLHAAVREDLHRSRRPAQDVILSLAAAPDGDLWIGTPDGLNRIRNGRIDAYTSADGLPDDFIRSLLVDADGSVWIGTRHGLTHWSGPAANLGRNRDLYPRQRLGQRSGRRHGARRRTAISGWPRWLGFTRITPGGIANFTTANGLSSERRHGALSPAPTVLCLSVPKIAAGASGMVSASSLPAQTHQPPATSTPFSTTHAATSGLPPPTVWPVAIAPP